MACPFFGKEHEDHECATCKHLPADEMFPRENANHICYPCMFIFTPLPIEEQKCNWEARDEC